MIKVFSRANGVAEVEIYSPIGQNWYGDGLTAKRFRDDLKALGNVSEIVVRINSPGGEVFDGFAIYNALVEHPAKVTVHVDGLAASIASVIAMAGDRILMGKGAMFMVHSPWTIAIGDAENMRATAEMLDKIEVGLVDAYVDRTSQDRKTVEGWMEGETWFTAGEAVEAGLADALADDESPESAAAWTGTKVAASQYFRAVAAVLSARTPEGPKSFDAPPASADSPKSAIADSSPEGDLTMTTANQSANAAADAQAREQILAAETNRRVAVRERFGKFADAHRVLLDACLDDVNCTAEIAGTRLLAELGKDIVPARPAAGSEAHVSAGLDGREKFRLGAAVALAFRSGIGKKEEGNEFNGHTLAALAARALELSGHSVRSLTPDAIARKVLAAQTSSDFPALLSTNAGKVLRAAYDSFPDTWNLWALKGSVSDFKIAPRIQLGSFNSLATIPEGGEYTYGSLAEEYENAQASTKGKALALTRQMIVNDDLGGFTRRAQLMGRAAARSVNGDAYAYLTSGGSNLGPTCVDTGQFFNATAVTTAGGHANYTGTGTAMSVAAFGVGRAAMRKQKDKGLKETLNIEPRVLVVPVGKEDLARQLMTSEADPANANSRVNNIYRGAFTVASDPYLDGISATAWYLFADPADVAAFEVVFLDGNETPYVDEAVDFDTDAIKYKVRLDYGIATGDWRAAYRNAGA
jgi:ATP-dependent protease ClpP protease subunit